MHCDEERCYDYFGNAEECSADGQFYYLYIDPSNEEKTEKYKSEFEPGTNYIKFHCDDDAKCMANDDGAGCFKPCGVQKTGSVGWCSSQTNETDATIYMTHTTTECELIDGQYVYFDDVPWRQNSDRDIWRLPNPGFDYAMTSFCPHECQDETGCVYYTASDGKECSGYDKSSCIEEDGKVYAHECKWFGYGKHYYIDTPCDACQVTADSEHAYCMEKCDSEGQTKSVCENYEATEWACVKQSDGQTYWASKQEKSCAFGCDGDHCKEIPGADEACDPAKYQSKCLDETSFLYCALGPNPLAGVARTWGADCGGLSSFFGREHICVNGENAVGCVPKDHSYPCQVEGQKIERCYQNEPASGGASSAFVYEMVCMKLPDGSLQYALPNSEISYYCQDRGYSDACNSGGTGCK